MDTLIHTLGDTVPYVATAVDEDTGLPLDLTGCSASLSVRAGGVCQVVPAVIDAAAGTVSLDLSGLTLPARAYRASLHVVWPDGARETEETAIALIVREGC